MELLAVGLPTFSESTWGFVGVVIGGLLVMMGDTIVDWRKARREERIERRRLNADVRVAARMVGDELDTIANNFTNLLRRGRTPKSASVSPAYLPSVEWHEHKRVLALVIDETDTWTDLATIYHNVASFKTRMAVDGPGATLSKDIVEILEGDLVTATALSGLLLDLARTKT
jgi:hypothetical protein